MKEMECTYKGFTLAQAEAHKSYMRKYIEVKVRMTPEKRAIVQAHAAVQGESTTAFINRAIDETIGRDNEKENA